MGLTLPTSLIKSYLSSYTYVLYCDFVTVFRFGMFLPQSLIAEGRDRRNEVRTLNIREKKKTQEKGCNGGKTGSSIHH